ncbi:MAG TPA: hypothetical protein VLJ88_02855 [Propionibacteriaceae bacterium]|nr:hypothetical protein [Propionibacteriaceae bacterium]
MDESDADLRARVARLESENIALRSQLEAEPADRNGAPTPAGRGRGRGWTVLAVVLIVLGCVMAPLAVVGGWAKSTLTETDTFVATYAPLAYDTEVQAFVIDQATEAINQGLNIEQLTAEVLDGIKALGTRPAASAALDALKEPAAQGLQTVIRDRVTDFVTSETFAQSWERALRVSHTQLLATLKNDPDAVITAQSDGVIGIQLGPIVEDVKAALLARNLSIAARIPAVDRTIPIAMSDQIATVQAGYRAVIAVGSWLPWVALIFLTAGVLVARRRSVALVGAAVGLGVSMLVLVLALSAGRALLGTAIPAALVPTTVTTLFYDTATAAMRDTAVIGVVLAAVIAIVAWLAGPFGLPRRLRSLYTDGIAGIRRTAEQHNITTGRAGEWIYAQRRVLHVVIALAAAAAIILLRPLSGSDIVGTLVVAVVALIVVSLIERPASANPPRPVTAPAATG